LTSSGTYAFQITNSSVVVQAFSRIGIRRTALLAEHMADAYQEYQLLLSSLSNLQPNLWTVELVSVPLVQGTATYNVDPSIVMILDAYISTGSGQSQNDRLILPISRDEYASYTNKNVQGITSVFWFNRQISPTITLWEVPDQTGVYTLNYYACRQMQDANLTGGETPNAPYRWYDALVAGMSHRMARNWKPELETARKQDFQEAFNAAATQDTENTSGLYVIPSLGGYYR